ncbi:MAG: hypothetical protein ABNH53_01730 [Henriciella sp.]|jgi:hypothetical protein
MTRYLLTAYGINDNPHSLAEDLKLKKTEKIEIRLDEAEKAGLIAVAEREDQSVSEMMRSLGNNYVKENLMKSMKFNWRQKLAWACAGGFVAILGSFAYASVQLEPAKEASLHVQIDDGQHRHNLSTNIRLDSSATQKVYVPKSESGSYLFAVTIESETKSLKVEVSDCQKDVCERIATPSLFYSEEVQTSVYFSTEESLYIELAMTPRFS